MNRAGAVLLAGAALALALSPAARGASDPPAPVSASSPFPPSCNGAVQPTASIEYRGAEVEPWIDSDPTDPNNLLAVWQQDRYSDGAANGLGVGVSQNGGQSWTRVPLANLPKFTRCQGAAAGSDGDYERASDPWVSFGPDGDAYNASLSLNEARDAANAILVSESSDGGATWGPVRVLRRDTSPSVFNDKEAITADHTDARYVYVVWDRIEDFPNGTFTAPIWFARTADGGATWEAAKVILEPGTNDSTVGAQIVVMPDGDLVNGYSIVKDGVRSVAVIRSGDKGASWSAPVTVSTHEVVTVTDPRTGELVRTGDVLPELASDERPGTNTLYMVWQDTRFGGGTRDQIVLSRSSDGGVSWSAPSRISTVPSTQAFTPAIRVDAAGNLGVTYYDFRNDTTASTTLDTDVWFLRSTDGGQTFTEERLTRSSFDMRAAPVARGFFVGDYSGLAAVGEVFKPLFGQSGTSGTDVFATTVRAPFGPAVTPPVPVVPKPTPTRPYTRPVTPQVTPRVNPRPSLRVGGRGVLGRRLASLRVRCLRARCSSRVELSAVLRTGGRRRPVILGSRSFRMRRGVVRLRVRLNRRARRLTVRRRRLASRAVLSARTDRFEFPVVLVRRR